jgi:hypothetical protein
MLELTPTSCIFLEIRAFGFTFMANDASTDDTVRSMPANNTADVEHPTEQLEIEENGVPEDETIYPTGPKLWLTLATLCVTMFLKGLVFSLDVIHFMKE